MSEFSVRLWGLACHWSQFEFKQVPSLEFYFVVFVGIGLFLIKAGLLGGERG
jgi:uncharacterized membrane protein